jgi:drug/metabolite transporter (DMT)-like permease
MSSLILLVFLFFFLQTYGSQFVSSNVANILINCSVLFTVLIAVILKTEPLSVKLVIGTALLFSAIVLTVSKVKQQKIMSIKHNLYKNCYRQLLVKMLLYLIIY